MLLILYHTFKFYQSLHHIIQSTKCPPPFFSGALPPGTVSLTLQSVLSQLRPGWPLSQNFPSLLSQVELRVPGFHIILLVGLLLHFVGVQL